MGCDVMSDAVSVFSHFFRKGKLLQSENPAKEKNKYILMHICGISKNCTDDLIYKAEIDTHLCRKQTYTKGGRWVG